MSTQFTEPNHYALHGKKKGFTITYSTTSITGKPLFSVMRDGETQSFSGDEIATQDGPLGRLVTVTIAMVPDLEIVTLTLVVPAYNLADSDGELTTFAVVTRSRTSIGGPALVSGQIQTYERYALRGHAQSVQS